MSLEVRQAQQAQAGQNPAQPSMPEGPPVPPGFKFTGPTSQPSQQMGKPSFVQSVEAGAQKVGSSIVGGFEVVRSYTAGPPLPPNATPQQEAQHNAYIAAGIVPGGDLIAIGAKAGVGLAGEIGARIGVGAAFGGFTSALRGASPEQVAEGAAFGAAFMVGATGAGRVAGVVGSKLEASAAAGRYADITREGASPTQRIAMKVTGSQTPAPPVAGAGVQKAMEIGPSGEPLGIPKGAKLTGKGLETTAPEPTQPPRDISNFLQDIEARTPTKAEPPTGGQPKPPNTVVPVSPFTEEVTSGPSGPMKAFISTPRESAFPKPGPSGGGYKGRGATETVYGQEQTAVSYPPGSAFSETERFRGMTEGALPRTSQGFSVPGFGFAVPERIGTNAGAFTETQAVARQPGQLLGQGQGFQEGLGSGVRTTGGTVVQPSQTQQPVQTPNPPKTVPGTSSISPPQSVFGFPRAPPSGGFSASFLQGPSMPKSSRRDKQRFGFREVKHPIGDLFTIRAPTGFKMKKGRGKK